MKYLADSEKAKLIDSISSEKYHIPSLVLMERAALKTAQLIMENECPDKKILVIAGNGNNAGDGIAAGRILHEQGYCVKIMCLSDTSRMTEQTLLQYSIARKCGIEYLDTSAACESINSADIIIDSLFGIGLSRDVSGIHSDIIDLVNSSDATVYSVDIPSGLNATTGNIMGNCIIADYTTTYGMLKTGLILNDSAKVCGKVAVCDIGFPKLAIEDSRCQAYYYDESDIARLPSRKPQSNKGTYGKVVICAGSPGISGAAYLAALAAYRSGCGLVKVLTCKENDNIIKNLLPEALVSSYDTKDIDNLQEYFENEILWGDSVVVGPGTGTDRYSEKVLLYVLKYAKKNIVVDADAINILSGVINDSNNELTKAYLSKCHDIIMTPHLKEMERFSGISISDMKSDICAFAKKYCYKDTILVLKDARTIVTDGESLYINRSGNNGLATGGSGDVLTGIIASLLAQGSDRMTAASLGVYVHGLAGDKAAEKLNRYSMMAGDIADSLAYVLK